jgi:WD40 repeat protein
MPAGSPSRNSSAVAESEQLLATLNSGVLWGVALSADGSLLAGGGADGTVRVWRTSTGQSLHTLQAHAGSVWGVMLSDDGTLLASGGADAIVRLWDTRGGQLLSALQGHSSQVWGVALSQDGRTIASGSADGTVRLWNPERGTCLRTLQADRQYERLNISGLTGVTGAQRAALVTLGAIDSAL